MDGYAQKGGRAVENRRKVIDSHWHLYVTADEKGRDFCAVMDETMEKAGLSGINICSIPIYHDLGPAQNILPLIYKLHQPAAFAYGGMVYPEKPFRQPLPSGMDFLSQYEELMEMGFDGIKMLETKPFEQKQYQVYIDDPCYEGLFAACEKNQTPMIWHAADPATFWDLERIPKRFLDRGWYYGDGAYMAYDEIYARVLRVLERHPRLKAVFAHFFFLSENPGRLEEIFGKYPGVMVDITPGAEMYADFREKHAFFREFFIRHADRILLGTDTSVAGGDMERFIQRYEAVRDFVAGEKEVEIIVEKCPGLHLPEEACEKILHGNFERITGETPRRVDIPALKKYAKKYRRLITDEKILADIDRKLSEL